MVTLGNREIRMSDDLSPQIRALLGTARIKVELTADAQGDYRWSGPGGLYGQGSTPLDAAHHALVSLAWAAEELALARAEVQALEFSLLRLTGQSGEAKS